MSIYQHCCCYGDGDDDGDDASGDDDGAGADDVGAAAAVAGTVAVVAKVTADLGVFLFVQLVLDDSYLVDDSQQLF